MGSISTRIDTDFSSRPQAFGASLPVEPVEVEVDDDPTVLDPEFGASVIEDEDPVEVEVDDDPTVLEPEFGASVIEDEDPVEVEVDDEPLPDDFGAPVIEDEDPVEVEVDDEPLPEDTLGATESGILTSWVATEEPKEDKKGKGGKKKKN
jgi:hypothetical protein